MKKPIPLACPARGLRAGTARPSSSTTPTLIGPPVFRPQAVQPKTKFPNPGAKNSRALETMIQPQRPRSARAMTGVATHAVYQPLQPLNVGLRSKGASAGTSWPPAYQPRHVPTVAQAKITDSQARVDGRQRAAPVQPVRAASARPMRLGIIQRVKCGEGEVKTAAKSEEVDFGGVTSCMTITCILEDGTKVSAHEGLEKRVPGGAYAALKSAIGTKKVAQVLAVGGGNYWSPGLKTSGEIIGDTSNLNFLQEQALLESKRGQLIVGAKQEFVAKLKSEFGTEAASFEDWDMGTVKISSDNKVTH